MTDHPETPEEGQDDAPPVKPEVYTDDDLCALLQCSKATLWRRRRDGTLPQPIRFGRAVRTRRADLEAALEAMALRAEADAAAERAERGEAA